jgi:hypothetical protein
MASGPASKRLEEARELLVVRADELSIALQQFRSATCAGIELSHQGVSLLDGLAATGGPSVRTNLNMALDAMEFARKEVRAAMVDVATEEGVRMSQLAKAIGVSRQLLSRFALENHPKEEESAAERSDDAIPR